MQGRHKQVLGMKGYPILVKLFILVAAVVMCMAVTSNDIYGYTAVRGTVVVKSGKVRKEANPNSAFVFGVTKDEVVTVIGEKKGDDGNLWYQIKVLNTTGYIRSDLIKKSNIEVKEESTIAIEEETKPDTNNKTENGNQVESNVKPETGAAVVGGGDGDYFTGTPVSVKGSNVIVREEASTKSGIRTMLQKGHALTLLSKQKGDDGKTWCYVSFVMGNSAFKGFICSDLVNMNAESLPALIGDGNENPTTPEKPETPGDNGDVPKTQVGKVKGMGVNVRETPVSGKVIGKLNTGNQITVIEQVRAKEDMNIWCKINCIYNQKPLTGYIRSDFTEGIELKVPGETPDDDNKNPGDEQKNPDEGNKEPENPDDKEGITPGEPTYNGSIKGVGVRVREQPVTGNVVCQLDTGYPVKIKDTVDGSDGYKWYKISFSKNDTNKKGYVRSDLVNVINPEEGEAPSDESFEEQIREFPDVYKPQLRTLHAKYPNWKFVPVNTGLEWNSVVAAETVVGKNLVAMSSIASWKSTAPQAYNWATNTWYGFDGGSWAAASPELIKYYLDPRNFLDDSGIFQFETLGFEEYQNEEGITNIVASTFMKNPVTDTDGVTRTYEQMFMDAGRTFNVSPYHLASRCVQEQGAFGTSQSISGKVKGFENLFNYFNIGAFAANGRTATINGLIYASGSDGDYYRPWNARLKSIFGSAKYISDKYVAVGQNTLYFQKFNVINSKNGLYSHQYMSNIVAASYESARLKKAYKDLNTTLVFRIPIYNNMPAQRCVKPTSDSNPNTYLSSIKIEGYEFTTPFSSVTNLYYLNVADNVEYVNVSAAPVSPTASVGGTGTIRLNRGDNKVQIVCKAQNGSSKVYTIMIRRGQ